MTARTTPTARRATCVVDGAGTKVTTLNFRFGAGSYRASLCKTCSYRMQADLFKWSRAGTKVTDGHKRGRLRDCDRCMVRTKATTWETLGFGRGTYVLALCEGCADRLYDELIAWVRVSTLVEDVDSATLKPTRSAAPGAGRIAKSIAPTAPVIRVEEVVEVEAAPAAKEWAVREEALPSNYKRWRWAAHALERFIQREDKAEAAGLTPMTVEDVLWTAENPDYIRPSTDPQWPTSKLHVRGFMQVVVNPDDALIVTVVDRRLSDGLRNAS